MIAEQSKKSGKSRSYALKARKESIDDDSSTSDSEDGEYVMAIRDFKEIHSNVEVDSLDNPYEERNSFQELSDKMARAKENALCDVIQIISSKNVQNYQDIKTKKRLLEDLGVIATKMKMKKK
ncbi:hypothetical protein Tco_1044073 [Tanacetum coccineum]|uniref:Uncharacterized protein n=1 Tax=Tanacetum coccineum TaxID=301880 RepID=A0ABQ5GRF9_9ASTR